MKKLYIFVCFVIAFILANAQPAPVNSGMWTWVNGSRLINPAGVYGTKGVASDANTPAGRLGSAGWKDKDGSLWLFGGQSATEDLYNDLWKYIPGKNVWIWMGGDTVPGRTGVYGTKGIAGAANRPGARKNAITWTDAAGVFWLFGGVGLATEASRGSLNDLWQYTPQNGWIWISGDAHINTYGIYGTRNVSAPANKPGGRESPVGWLDANGNLWLHGGSGYGRDSIGRLNDLWQYNTKNNRWTWISGTPLINQAGIYGTKGNAAAQNMPGCRYDGLSWTDKAGNCWLLGGYGNAAAAVGYLDDIWKFDVAKQVWTWMGGDNLQDQVSFYGTQGVADINNKPGGRAGSTGWQDSDGNFWLLGGAGPDQTGRFGLLNDLWKLDAVKQSWTWISGDKRMSVTGIYGTQGLAGINNKPGGRDFAVSWLGNNDELWLFGGSGWASQGSGNLNDLWRFNPIRTLSCPASRVLPNDTFCALRVFNIDPVTGNGGTTNYSLSGATLGSGNGTASGLSFNPGITTVVYKLASDANTTCAFAVEVDDHTPPVPLKDSLPVLTGDCAITVTDRPKARDNCAGIVTGTTTDALSYTSQGTYTITWTYTDGHNNITTQKQSLIVRAGSGALTPLTASLPDIVGECMATVTNIPVASKNCAGFFAATTTDPLSYTKQGSYTITWVYNDQNGSVIRQQQRVIVKDTTPPVPQNDSLADITGACTATAAAAPTAIDNCAGKITAVTSDSLTHNSPGTYYINWIFDDGHGNSVRQKQRLVVRPGAEPLTPLVTSLPNISSDCSASITNLPQATGSCGHLFVADTHDPLAYSKQGEYTITWTYHDDNGNTLQQLQRVIIKDQLAPVPLLAELPDITAECSVSVTERPLALDNCAGKIAAQTKDPLFYSKQGTYVINWIYNDGNGNTQTQQQRVIIKNPVSLLPRFLVLPDITGDCEVRITSRPTIQDYCLGTIAGSTADSLYYNKPGTYTIYWKYVTSNDDTVVQKQSVVVKNLSLSLNAYPNPATDYFNLTVKSCNHTDKINLRVFDLLGRVVENRMVQPYQPINLGTHYAVASYFVQVIQGKESITQKIIKLK